MTHEYNYPINESLLDGAAATAAEWQADAGLRPAEERAAAAVHDVFCPCVTDAGDAIDGQRSTIHAGLIDEVRQRAERIINQKPEPQPPPDAVEIASDHSFPASDPPAWIWRRSPAAPGKTPVDPTDA